MDHVSPELAPDCRATPTSRLLAERNEPGEHFLRSHHGVPHIDERDYALEVTGLVTRPIRWSLTDLRKLSHTTAHVTLECAGHRRTELDPPAAGVPWALGAVGHARWAGGQLTDLLSIVRPLPEATHIVFHGSDLGEIEGYDAPQSFSRAVPLHDPAIRETILAWEMNGRRLEPEHGYPVRAIVPGWYAVASVKWLTRIELIGGEFGGFYQAIDYRLREEGEPEPGRELTHMPISSLITSPEPSGDIPAGSVRLRGIAWGGTGGVGGVDVQVDDGSWLPARIDPGPGRHAPTEFSLAVELAPGKHIVRSKARDRDGNRQPDKVAWNSRGYGVNDVYVAELTVS
ncbi:MAG: molybdopterin-dependent oxidoreductase [Gaiellales bacterium]